MKVRGLATQLHPHVLLSPAFEERQRGPVGALNQQLEDINPCWINRSLAS